MREKKCYVNLIMAIVLLVVAFVVYKNIPIAKDYSTLVEKDGDIENNYVEINVKNIAKISLDGNMGYYFVKDDKDYLYVVKLWNRTYNKIEKKYNDKEINYCLKGYIFNIPDDVRDMAILGLSNSYDIDINKDNYSDYFGNTYLDEGRILQGRIIVIVVSTMLFIVGIMLFIGFIREMKIIRLEKKNTYKKIVRKDSIMKKMIFTFILLMVFITPVNSLVVSKDLAPVEKSDGVSSVISGMNMICKEQKGTQGEVTFKEIDGIKSINITGNKSYGYYNCSVNGLDPNKIYVISANVKVEDYVGNKGGVIGIYRNEDNSFYNFALSSYNNTNEYKKLEVVLKPEYDGKGRIVLGFWGIEDYYAMGTVYIKDIAISLADDRLVQVESDDKKVKLVVWKEDVDSASLTNDDLKKITNKYSQAYKYMAELVGNSSHGTLYPYKNGQLVYMMTNYHIYGAISGFPIEANRKYTVNNLKSDKKDNFISWTFLHETGHLFDLPLYSSDNSYVTSRERFTKEKEQTASFYPLYAMEKMNIITDNNYDMEKFILNNYKTQYDNYVNGGTWSGGCGDYLLSLVRVNGKMDWDSFKKTYKWFNDLSKSQFDSYVNRTNNKKIAWYLKKLDDFSSFDVKGIFNDRSLNDFISKYVPTQSIDINITSMIGKNGPYFVLNEDVNPAENNDIIEYSSSDESVLSINEYGVLNMINSSGNAVITARSFFNPNITATYEYVGNSQGNSGSTSSSSHEIFENPETGLAYKLVVITLFLSILIFTIVAFKTKKVDE